VPEQNPNAAAHTLTYRNKAEDIAKTTSFGVAVGVLFVLLAIVPAASAAACGVLVLMLDARQGWNWSEIGMVFPIASLSFAAFVMFRAAINQLRPPAPGCRLPVDPKGGQQ
jgi:hypothetical protein